MIYTEQQLKTCLESRLAWYSKAISIMSGKIPWDNNFDFPFGNVDRWLGSQYELQNTLNMMNAKEI